MFTIVLSTKRDLVRVTNTVVQIKVPKLSPTSFHGNMGSFSQILSESYFTMSLLLELKANFSLGNKNLSLTIHYLRG